MKKIAITLFVSTAFTPAFAASKTTTQSSKNSPSKIYPMDSFDPMKFSVSNISEFTKRYATEAEVFLKKKEFETTAEYETRITKGFKTKSLDSSKIYAFQFDSIQIKYNPDQARYEITNVDSPDIGRIFGDHFGIIRVGKINRTSGQYKASNAYGTTANVIRIHGTDFYIKSSNSFTNVSDDSLLFPVEIESAKKNSSCKKQVYIFGKLNGQAYKDSSYDFAAIEMPKINLPVDIQIRKRTIPMDVQGVVLKCSNGAVLSVQIPAKVSNEQLKDETNKNNEIQYSDFDDIDIPRRRPHAFDR